ncbi:MAG: hypothetical protein DRQ49_03150 [Gammaproteobacteria bacterium]|nr:MAG: hypothetical protein DRQ41_14545 [Gammaproteobacteria bacterium]RKZ42025.1 MAG: hypothetical protein DRQ49_03150 [Gammaproteobacteria bacterium]
MKLKLLIVAFAMLLVTNASANIILEKSTVDGMAVNMTTNIMLVMTKSEANFRYLTEIVAKKQAEKKYRKYSKKSRSKNKHQQRSSRQSSQRRSQPRQGSSRSTQKRSESRR